MADAEPLRGLRVLVVGGGGQAARELDSALRRLGLEAQIASTGGKALLDMRRASDDDRSFGAVIIHSRLPDRYGSDLVLDIRREARLGTPCLVLISEQEQEAIRAQAMEGVVHLRRPFDPGQLLSKILSLAGPVANDADDLDSAKEAHSGSRSPLQAHSSVRG